MRRVGLLWLTLAVVVSAPAGGGQTPPATTGDDATDELVARERIRAGVESIFEIYGQPSADGGERIDTAIRSAEALRDLGPDVVPYLANEIEQHRIQTLDLCSYALGMLGTEEAQATLRKAIARADDDSAPSAKTVKAWASWGLGLQGEADAVDLVAGGMHGVATFPIHGQTSLLESIAIQTAPESVPRLLAILERVKDAEDDRLLRRATLRALRRVGDPTAAPKVIPLLNSPKPIIRREAANALRGLGSPATVRALVDALDEENRHVRQSIALALEYIGSDSYRKELLEHLETETDPATRGALYRLMADTADERTFEILERDWPSADKATRVFLIEALGHLDDPRRIEILDSALLVANNNIALRAVLTLSRIGGPAAVAALTGAVSSARLHIAHSAADRLGGMRATGAAPAIARRLVGDLLAEPITNLRLLLPLEKMTAALIRLGYPAVLPQLREALTRQTNPNVIRVLEKTVRQLEILQRNGKKTARWIETAGLPELELRLLAYDHLGHIGDAAASRALLAAFDRVEAVTERVEILRALGQVERPEVAELLDRLLLGPEFDPTRLIPLRDMAAWIARQRGGDAMYELLKTAATRRNGRDVRVLVYAALLGGKHTLPLLESLRKPRMRYLGWQRGVEQERLEWIATRLKLGHPLLAVDVAPEKLSFR